MIDCDVLIAGGGPAGISTWLHLHALAPQLAAGAILIEKETHPRHKLCGGGVTPLADAMLRSLGIRTQCPSVAIHRIEFRFGAERFRLEKKDAFRVVRRHEFDHELAEAALARGLTLHAGEALVGFAPEGDCLRVETTRESYRTRVLVGADGVYSAVREQIPGPVTSHLARLLEVVTPVDERHDPEFAEHTAVFDFSPVAEGLQGYLWHFPCLEGGVASMNRGICDTRTEPRHGHSDLRALFGRELEARGVSRPPRTWEGFPVRCFSRRDTLAAPHVILVGDAAGIDPALGEGIAQSMDYGDLAANSVIDAFGRGDFSFGDYKDRLLRHPLGRSLQTRTRLARRLYGRLSPDLERLRQLWIRWLPAG